MAKSANAADLKSAEAILTGSIPVNPTTTTTIGSHTMALTYDLTGIKNWSELCFHEDRVFKVRSENIIFITLGVEMGEITEKNLDEFYWRIKVWARALGTDFKITKGELALHIGLKTNVKTITKKQFLAKICRVLEGIVPEGSN